MAQGSLFAGGRDFIINIDGASRGNPGPSAAAWVIQDKDGQILIEEGLYLGKETNNRAEYFGLLFGLEDALLLKADSVEVRSDSQLLVRQMTGEYRVKNTDLKPIYLRAKRLSQSIANFKITHVPREENKVADHAANVALDAEKS